MLLQTARYVPPPAMTLMLCNRHRGRGARRLSVGIAVGALGEIPEAQPRPGGLLCHPRRTEDGHERGPGRNGTPALCSPQHPTAWPPGSRRETVPHALPQTGAVGIPPPAGQNYRGPGKGNVLSTGHHACRRVCGRRAVEAEPALSARNCRKKQEEQQLPFFYGSKPVSSAMFSRRSHAPRRTSSGHDPRVPDFKALKQNFFMFEGLTDDSSLTAEEKLIQRHDDYATHGIKTKNPAATSRLWESTGSMSTSSKLLFFLGKTSYSFFCMLTRVVAKL